MVQHLLFPFLLVNVKLEATEILGKKFFLYECLLIYIIKMLLELLTIPLKGIEQV